MDNVTRRDLIRFIERGIESGSTHDVHTSAGTNSVTVQTIHATKGLEYPIVILANMNSGRFPPGGGGSDVITYDDPVGLRQRKVYSEDAHELPHVYDNWKADVLGRCIPRDYDEERRLLYVAITRAQSHVVFSAGEEPNTFIEELPVAVESVEPELPEISHEATDGSGLEVEMPVAAGPRSHTPHTLMRDDAFEGVEGGRGTDFGSRVHDFAEAYALGDDVAPDTDDEETVKRFIDELDGELLVEEDAYLPLSVDGERVTISGVVDLVHVLPDRVEIIDYKTDRGRHAEAEYRKQLSVYYHVAEEVYPDRDVSIFILYTATGACEEIEPLSLGEVRELVTEMERT